MAIFEILLLVFLIFIHFKSGPNDSVETPPRNAPEVTSHNDTELDLHKCIAANSDEIRVKGGFYTHTKEYCPDIRWKFWDVPKEERLNPKIDYGTLTDARDGHKYKTVQIGNQTWMAENLKYVDTLKMDCSRIDGYRWCANATCLDEQNKTCDVVGVLYTWAAAVDSARLVSESVNPEKCCFCDAKCSVPAKVQGVCPDGWHLPSDDEWNTLFVSVGGVDVAGQALKARIGWGKEDNLDAYGFSALPTGLVHMSHVLLENTAFFWSASDSNHFYAHNVMVSPANSSVSILKYTEKHEYLTVRCVKDDSAEVTASGIAAKPKSENASPFSEVTRGFMKDTRDGQTYKTVKIGDQTWMAKNLNYRYNEGSAKSYCYGNRADLCTKYGRLYTWAAAIDSVQIYKDTKEQCGDGQWCKLPEKVRGVCPSGWHLPTKAEWDMLITTVGCPCKAGKALKARSGWNELNGTDDYGFSALPGGMRYEDDHSVEKPEEGRFMDAGYEAIFWSATEETSDEASWMFISAYQDDASTLVSWRKHGALSVRCVKD